MTETRDASVTWLTQEAYDRLKAELDHLSGTRPHRDREEDRGGPGGRRPAGERRVPRGQGRAGPDRGADRPAPAHPGERPGGRPAAHRRGGRAGHDGHHPVRQGRRGGDLPARLARGERLADRRLLAQVPAGLGHHGQEGRREGHLLPAQRPTPARWRSSKRSPTWAPEAGFNRTGRGGSHHGPFGSILGSAHQLWLLARCLGRGRPAAQRHFLDEPGQHEDDHRRGQRPDEDVLDGVRDRGEDVVPDQRGQ